MKKIISILMAVLMIISLNGCAGYGDDHDSSNGVDEYVQEEYNQDEHIQDEYVKTVVITRTGSKYHRSNCRYVVAKNDTKTIPLEQALKEGYEACKVCDPD